MGAVCQPPILTFCEIRVAVSPFGHCVYTAIGKRLVTRNKPFIVIDEIAVFAKSVRIAEVFAIESRFPPHPHIKNNVLSSDEVFESIPFIPQSLIGIFRIGSALPVQLPKLFLVLILPVGKQTSEHHPEHLDSIHFFYQFLSFRCTNIIAQIALIVNRILEKFF